MELDLYKEDFIRNDFWIAVCQSVGIDGTKVDHIIIDYNTARGFDSKGDEI